MNRFLYGQENSIDEWKSNLRPDWCGSFNSLNFTEQEGFASAYKINIVSIFPTRHIYVSFLNNILHSAESFILKEKVLQTACLLELM